MASQSIGGIVIDFMANLGSFVTDTDTVANTVQQTAARVRTGTASISSSFSGVSRDAATMSGNFRQHMTFVGDDINRMIDAINAGRSPLSAFLIELPKIADATGQGWAVAGGMIIGVVGTIVAHMFNLGDSEKDAQKAAEEHEKALKSLNDVLGLTSKNADDLAAKFQTLGTAEKQLAVSGFEQQISDANKQLSSLRQNVESQLQSYQSRFNTAGANLFKPDFSAMDEHAKATREVVMQIMDAIDAFNRGDTISSTVAKINSIADAAGSQRLRDWAQGLLAAAGDAKKFEAQVDDATAHLKAFQGEATPKDQGILNKDELDRQAASLKARYDLEAQRGEIDQIAAAARARGVSEQAISRYIADENAKLKEQGDQYTRNQKIARTANALGITTDEARKLVSDAENIANSVGQRGKYEDEIKQTLEEEKAGLITQAQANAHIAEVRGRIAEIDQKHADTVNREKEALLAQIGPAQKLAETKEKIARDEKEGILTHAQALQANQKADQTYYDALDKRDKETRDAIQRRLDEQAAMQKKVDDELQQRALNQDPLTGAKAGLLDIEDQIFNVGKSIRETMVNDFGTAQTALEDFVLSGKMNLASLQQTASTIMMDLARQALRIGESSFLQWLLSAGGGAGAGGSGLFAGGGFLGALAGLFGKGGGGVGASESFSTSTLIAGGDMTPFATGGSFTVGGAGGTDSQVVAFRATPGELVDVRTPETARSGATGVVMNYSIDARGATDPLATTSAVKRALDQHASRVKRDVFETIRRTPNKLKAA